MKINLDSSSDDARIEIIPLIDVIFCILTFFILAALHFARLQFTRQQAINVDLPQTSTSATTQVPNRLLVYINPFGQVYVEQEPIITPEQLLEKLQQYRQAKPDGLLVLYASKTASYNDVVQVLDRMRQVGGDRVALATDPLEQSPQTTNEIPSPAPGVPSLAPGTGSGSIDPYNPYGTNNPANPFNPTVPPSPVNPGQLPGGVNPVIPNGSLTPTVPPTSGVPTPPATAVPTP